MTTAETDIREASLIREADLRELLDAEVSTPCVSIYLPATPRPTEADRNRIGFKDLVKRTERELDRMPESKRSSEMLASLQRLAEDQGFWRRGRARGVAVFRSPRMFRAYRLLRDVPEAVSVADSFHVKPLIRVVQTDDRYQVLCLSLNQVELYQGNRDILEPVPLANVPRSMAESLPGEPIPEGPESELEAAAKDQRKQHWVRHHFERVDAAVRTNHSIPSGLPLVLAALPEYHGLFQEISRNPQLLPAGVRRDPFRNITREGLRDAAWEAVESALVARQHRLRERFSDAKAHGQGVETVERAAELAAAGGVDTLLIDAQTQIGGTVDPRDGTVTYRDIEDPAVDDVLDDIGELTLRHKGSVQVFPRNQMPTDTGIAAILRYRPPEG